MFRNPISSSILVLNMLFTVYLAYHMHATAWYTFSGIEVLIIEHLVRFYLLYNIISNGQKLYLKFFSFGVSLYTNSSFVFDILVQQNWM